jgi:hypothetical protein
MSATSRRKFLSGAAAAAAATAAACGGGPASPPPANPAGNTSPGGAAGGVAAPTGPMAELLAMPVDNRVAVSFLMEPLFLDPALDLKPKSSVLLYGLVCVDFGDQELLLPNTNGLTTHGVHSHRARLWLAEADVEGGSASPDGNQPFGSLRFSFWDINNRAVKIEALDSAGAVLTSPSGNLAARNSPLHPWTDMKWVRCLKDITDGNLLPTTSRNNPALISSRVEMLKGAVTAVPPATARGQLSQWKVARYGGGEMLNATTDAMVWQREYSPTVAKYRISLTPIPTGTASVITVKATAQSLAAAVTHAMPSMGSANFNMLTDTRAFAQLLVGGNVATHPTPVKDRNGLQAYASSGSDGHCECACN